MIILNLLLLGILTAGQAPAARTHLVIVAGIGGTPEHSGSFTHLGLQLADAAHDRYGMDRADIHYFAEDPDRNPERIRGRSSREQIESCIHGLAETAGPEDRILLVLIGHGSFDEEEAKFNLPGPDLSAPEFALLLDSFGSRPLALVNCASSSGPFIETLSKPGRIIVTATRSGRERNETVFATFFVEAFADEGADLDKDRRISLLEAFQYARRSTSDHYEQSKEILTEHALLDDNGDGEGSADIDLEQGDGLLARSFFLEADPEAAIAERAGTTSPELAALYQKRREIQNRIEVHRARKNELDPETYMNELERILLELATINQEIRKLGGGV